MFTGLIEEMGSYIGHDGDRYQIGASGVLEDAKIGDSIAVNGCCVTVIDRTSEIFETEVTAETLSRTTFGLLRPGDPVNLERPVRATDRLGGHVVQGHVDAIGEVTAGPPELKVRIPADLMRYCVEKGSIAIDGVSLTVNAVTEDFLEVALIPHTLQKTKLGAFEPGQRFNVEVDLVARYVARWASTEP